MQKSGADLLLEEEAKRNAAEKAAKEKSTVDFYAWLRGAYNDLIEVNMLAKGNQAAKLPDEDLKEFGKLYAQVVAHEFGFTPPYYAKLLAMEARHHVQSYQLGQEVIKLRKMQEELKKQQEQIQK